MSHKQSDIVTTFEKDGKWYGAIFRYSTGQTTEWEINEHAARMIAIAKEQGKAEAKRELWEWLGL